MVLLARITNIIIMLYCQWARGTRLRYSASSCKQKSLEPITETHPDCLAIYQDDVAIAASTIEKTMEIAKLVKQQMALAGLKCNEEKTHWNPTDTKPLLGAIWSPLQITQKEESIIQLQKLHQRWMDTRQLKDRQRFQGKLASLGNFPGVVSAIAANEKNHGPEERTIQLLK
eukprot:GHVP01011055.1.p1 GENE.GHVP01011055.1~~GHVP01011055.1.p1  ORF type:complete len:172 (-),score=18.54 GHVP01011055.1:171-686(-)